MRNKIILVDADGVLLDWEYAFDVYLRTHGFNKVPDGDSKYEIGKRYGIDVEQGRKLIKIFNESAHIGFLPPLRDAMHYVKRLHEEHGYVFHCITSLSSDQDAQELRRMNLRKLFGETAFEKFVFLETGEDKDAALETYRGSGLWWIEDKIVNCRVGAALGLRPLLMEHAHNRDFQDAGIPKMTSWKSIYNHILHIDDLKI
jgi:hypothetical protein